MNLSKLKQLHSIEDDDLELAEELVVAGGQSTTYVSGMDIALQPGDEIIDGKLYKAYQFKPGNSMHKLRKEGARDATVQREVQEIHDLRMFKHWARTHGIQRCLEEIQKLEGKDFITAFLNIIPYALPKIAAVESKSSDEIIPIDAHQNQHTITVKDFRTGLITTIQEE